MLISVNNQVVVFLYSVLGGIIMAFIYDIFRVKRKKLKSRALVTYLEDLLYWIIAALVMFATVYLSNDGEIRSYVILGTLIGIIVYSIFLSKIVVAALLAVIKFMIRLFTAVWRLVTYPVVIIYKILRVPVSFLLRIAGNSIKKARRVSKLKLSIIVLKRRIFRNSRKKI